MPVNAFKWKHFVGEIILQTVRWYLNRDRKAAKGFFKKALSSNHNHQ